MTLSPPPSRNSEMFQHDLHHLVAHNANTSYPQPKYDPDEGIHMQTHYESPISHEDQYMRRPQQTSYPYQHQHQDSGLGIQYVSCWKSHACLPKLIVELGISWFSGTRVPGSIQHTSQFAHPSIPRYDKNEKWPYSSTRWTSNFETHARRTSSNREVAKDEEGEEGEGKGWEEGGKVG